MAGGVLNLISRCEGLPGGSAVSHVWYNAADCISGPSMQPAHNTTILKLVLLVLLSAFSPAFPGVSYAAPTPHSAPKVGLVLSGGGARGAAHIGVLKVLEREGVNVDCIAGTSFGALVGALYALGYHAAEIEELFATQDWSSIFSDAPERGLSSLFERRNFRYQGQLSFVGLSPELPSGLYRGQKIIEVLDALTTQRMIEADYDFDRLPIPFRAVATNLLTGEQYIFDKGRMTEALRASMAIPMFFAPVEKEDMLLADGGLSDNIPTDVALKMGADFIIAVDVTSPLLKKEEIRSFFDVLDQSVSLAMRQNIEKNLSLANFVIRPELESFTYSSYEAVAEIQKRGEEEAERQVRSLKEKLGPASPVAEPRNPIDHPIRTITVIEFHGLRKVSTRQLMGEIRSRVGDPLDPAILSGDLKRLYATNLFENVDYSVEPLPGQGHRLTYLLQEAPLNTLGASIRYDKEYKFVALAEFTARQIFNTPSTLMLSSQFGGLEDHSLALRVIFPQVSALFLEPRVNISRLDRLDIRNQELVDTFRDRRVGGQLMLGGTFRRLEIAAGYRQESVSIRGGAEPNRLEDSVSLAGLTLRINRDTLDHQEFAQKGMALHLQVDKRIKTLGGDLDYSRWEVGVRPFFSISGKSTLELSAVAGFSRGPLPFYERFYAGAYSFAEKGPHHFLGFSRDELTANQLAMLASSYRYQIFSHPVSFARRGFLFGTYNFAAVSSHETSPYDFTYFNGGGFGLAIDTLLGPARIALGWGSSGEPKLYVSIGPSF